MRDREDSRCQHPARRSLMPETLINQMSYGQTRLPDSDNGNTLWILYDFYAFIWTGRLDKAPKVFYQTPPQEENLQED